MSGILRAQRHATTVGVVALFAALIGAAAPAHAAFPGQNGQIAFSSARDGSEHIFLMNADGTGQTGLNRFMGTDMDPAWSADGTRIAFTRLHSGIYVMNADGTGVVRLTDSGLCSDSQPAWSPDGTQIAFHSTRPLHPGEPCGSQIWVMNADGTDQHRISSDGADGFPVGTDSEPSWSPDGARIAFTSLRYLNPNGQPSPFGEPNQDVWVMDSIGGNEFRLTTDPAFDGGADWSPGGSTIVYQSTAPGEDSEIFTVPGSGGAPTVLTANDDYEATPAWSPDGSQIVFSRSSGFLGPTNIYTLALDGMGPTQLTTSGSDHRPDWQPVRSTLAVDDIAVDEGDSGTVHASFTVTLTNPSGGTVVVDYATTDGSAAAGSDYAATSGTLTFAPGEVTKTIEVSVFGDTVDEGTETFTLELSGAQGAEIADGVALARIFDDDAGDPDRDEDGVADGTDNCPDTPNTAQTDQDGDGIGDACDPDRDGDEVGNSADNCPNTTNPGQEDLDSDAVGDACDPDRDGDALGNEADNCPDTANAGQADSDSDGVGDACDADRDGDEVPDASDNCPGTPNAGQADADGDAQGDACDQDRDGDGAPNASDNCPDAPNPDQADGDSDGKGDACDEDRTVTEQIGDLQETVEELPIHAGTKKSLSAKLRNATAAINAGDRQGGCGKLSSFTHEVHAQSGKKIPSAQASQLIGEAERIQESAGCH